jgi:hypothetical protein
MQCALGPDQKQSVNRVQMKKRTWIWTMQDPLYRLYLIHKRELYNLALQKTK